MSNGTPGQAAPEPAPTAHKKTNSLGPLQSLNGSGIKYVKPQELNLDMIVPSSMKGVKPSNSTIGGPLGS